MLREKVGSAEMSRPSIRRLVVRASSRPAMRRSVIDFPEPEGPRMARRRALARHATLRMESVDIAMEIACKRAVGGDGPSALAPEPRLAESPVVFFAFFRRRPMRGGDLARRHDEDRREQGRQQHRQHRRQTLARRRRR